MKYLLFPLLTLLISSMTVSAQKTGKRTYAITVSFQSICCGVPDQAPLDSAIRRFKKKQKLKKPVRADKIGPLGREGEYTLAFTLSGMTRNQKKQFISMLEKVIPLLKDRGQASLQLNETYIIADLPARATIEKIKW